MEDNLAERAGEGESVGHVAVSPRFVAVCCVSRLPAREPTIENDNSDKGTMMRSQALQKPIQGGLR